MLKSPLVMYVVPAYPVRSETFVRREVEALRGAGDVVPVVGLRPSKEPGRETGDVTVLYQRTSARRVMREVASHPRRAMRTVLRAMADAIRPGEPTCWSARIKLPAQAVAGLALAGLTRESGVRHLHAHFAHASATVAMYAAMQAAITFSFTGHANDLFARRSVLTLKIRRAAFVACISMEHRALYRSLAPEVAESRLPIVRCGVPISSPPSRVRDPERLRLLTVARLVPKKGIDTLIRAVALMPERAGVCLTVAGDGPERERLCELASGLGVRVTFVGAVEPEHVPRLMADSDLFVLPCRTDANGDRDGIPVVLMEAMACGLPVVSGDLPAIRELVEHDVTGTLVAPDDPDGLASTLSQLSADHARLSRLAAAGLERVRDEFSLERNVGRLREQFLIASERTLLPAAVWTPVPPTAAISSCPPVETRPDTADVPSTRSSPRPAARTCG